ncbi:MAG: TonB family protein [Acidobacteriota bacterium]|nr:TonB family protein [Acidobacteriota bacterium]
MHTTDSSAPAQNKGTAPVSHAAKERRRMLVALAVLIIALIAVAIRNREFWAQYSSPAEQQDSSDDNSGDGATKTNHPKARVSPPTARSKAPQHVIAAKPSDAPPVVTARTVLPPLEVEVVAGNKARPVQTGNNSIRVELDPGPRVSSAAPISQGLAEPSAADVASGVQVTRGAAEVISRPVKTDYPLLARQMKVQGAVVLQALIGKKGTIQDLQIVSGPAILSSAARAAVSQWKFKPYYQQGQPVETQARITVNFTISTY